MAELSGLTKGTMLGEYEIDTILGSGGFGITYKALDHNLHRHVAIKEYFPSGIAERVDGSTVKSANVEQAEIFSWGLDRFEEEARMLARFRHANILRVAQVMRANDTAYMVLDYLEGQTLSQRMADLNRPLTQDEIDRLILPVLDALETVHKHEILHRDIAPKNIFLREDGVPILIDFGSARQSVTARTQAMTAVLTPGYAPFEQYIADGETQGPWTDIYALSATLYEAISGTVPPEAPGRTVEDHYVLSAQAVDAAQYRQPFLQAIDWALNVRPSDRPRSVAEWRDPLLASVVAQPGPAKAAEQPKGPADLPPTILAEPIVAATKLIAQGDAGDQSVADTQRYESPAKGPLSKGFSPQASVKAYRAAVGGGLFIYIVAAAVAAFGGLGLCLFFLSRSQTGLGIGCLLAGLALSLVSIGFAAHRSSL